MQKTHNYNAAASVDKETDMLVQLNGFKFIEYTDKNFIRAKNGRTGIRNQPRFPHTLWNKY